MDTENPKPQTGGLKLMTVFIAVLALHVVVIGGVTAYHFFKGKNSPDVAATDKALDAEHKDAALASDTAALDAGKTPEIPAVNTSEISGTDGTTTPTTSVTIREPLHDPAPLSATENSPVALAPVNPVTLPPSAPVASKTAPTVAVPAAPVAETKPAVAIADYMVKKGDSLFRIAKASGTTVAHLKELNGLAKDNLKIGQTIKIPEGSTVARMETSSEPVSPIVKSTKSVAKAAAPAKASAGSYKVVKGDSLYRIAKKFKVSPNALMAANGIKDPTKLTVGRTITIPGSAEKRVVTEQRETAKPLNAAPQKTADIAMNSH